MKKIITDYGKKEYYDFISYNYPWNYGSYDYFKWKHLLDPYCNESDFYVMKDDDNILALCVARKYNYFFNGEILHALCMMDFVTRKECRQKGHITDLSEYAKSVNSPDITLGFSGEELYDKVYKKLCNFQRFYTYQFTSNNISAIKAENIEDIGYICKKMNSAKNSLHLNKTPEYMKHLFLCPRYSAVYAAQHNGLIVLIGINNNIARVLDISDHSFESCRCAVRLALNYADNVLTDFTYETDCDNGMLKKITCSTSDDISLLKGDGDVWIPVMDRK